MPGLEGSTSPQSPAGSSCSPEQLPAHRDRNAGESIWIVKAKREGLLPTWRGSKGKARFSQGVSLFKLLAFLGLYFSLTLHCCLARDLCKIILHPDAQYSCSVATRHHFQTIPSTLDQKGQAGRFSQETQAKLLLAALWAPQAECSCELLALLLTEGTAWLTCSMSLMMLVLSSWRKDMEQGRLLSCPESCSGVSSSEPSLRVVLVA